MVAALVGATGTIGALAAPVVAGVQAASSNIAGINIGMARGMAVISSFLDMAGVWRHQRQ